LVTRRKAGSKDGSKRGTLIVAAWNLVPPDQTGSTKKIRLRFEHLAAAHEVSISRVDRDHGDVHPAYERMGQPRYPTPKQIKELQQAARLTTPEIRKLTGNELILDIAPNGLAVIEIK
jgi:xylan 1,4-beta-xylosidase